MRRFFNLEPPYKLEWQDARAIASFLNTALILAFGVHFAWVGLGISALGLIKDLTNRERHINDIVLHLSTIVLNIYLLTI